MKKAWLSLVLATAAGIALAACDASVPQNSKSTDSTRQSEKSNTVDDKITALYEAAQNGDAKAVEQLSQLAEQDNVAAQYFLAMCYENGCAVEAHYTSAFNWYRKAVANLRKSAERGNALAQYNLGLCYANGRGVAKDLTEAVKWYKLAAEQGNVEAKKALKRLQK